VTAKHVVQEAYSVAENLHVEFWSRAGEQIEAELLSAPSISLDLAVLAVDYVEHSIRLDPIPFACEGDPTQLELGAPVYSMGNARGEPWSINVRPDAISETGTLEILFESSFITGGQSGGALFNADWELIGMVTADEAPNARAIPVNVLKSVIEENNLPWNLERATEESSSKALLIGLVGAGGAAGGVAVLKSGGQDTSITTSTTTTSITTTTTSTTTQQSFLLLVSEDPPKGSTISLANRRFVHLDFELIVHADDVRDGPVVFTADLTPPEYDSCVQDYRREFTEGTFVVRVDLDLGNFRYVCAVPNSLRLTASMINAREAIIAYIDMPDFYSVVE
jgi:hypothetical protein